MGPLIITGVVIDKKDLIKLENIGVKDSKLLTQRQRELLANEIKKVAKFKAIRIEPYEIDEAVDGDNELNLNWLEAHKTAEIINSFDADEVYIDCPSTNINAYENYLRKLLNKEVKLIIEHKADVKYVVVGAASIIAKCLREEEVKKIEKKVGESIGTGYPSNPICQKFLKDNFEKYPEIFRKSWMTVKNHKTAKEQRRIEDFE